MTNQTLASWSSDLINHSYDYQIELDPLGPITVTYSTYKDFWNKLSIKMSLSAYLDNVIKLLIVGKSTSPQLACASWGWDGGGCWPTWGGEGGEGLRVFILCRLSGMPLWHGSDAIYNHAQGVLWTSNGQKGILVLGD